MMKTGIPAAGLLAASVLALAGPAAAAGRMEAKIVDAKPGGGEASASELPFAQGRSFATLDDYLAHLRRRGATGVPFYREVSPGVYELVARRGPGARPERATRDELMRRFGFAR
jgi:hypothetical protein